MNIEVIKEFVMQNWLVIVVALIILFFVLNVVKTMLKWAIAIIIIAALLIYSGISMEQIKQTVTDVQSSTVDTLKKEAASIMLKEASRPPMRRDKMVNLRLPVLMLKLRAARSRIQSM